MLRASKRMSAKRSKSQTTGFVRLIAGQWRGQRLSVADISGLRPTTDRVRETLFNWLMPYLADARCLDLCAGTGALGFECLSRGAQWVDFVEPDRSLCKTLQQNIQRFDANAVVTTAKAEDYLAKTAPSSYDIVFIDPPFADQLQQKLCDLLHANAWLADQALIYVEQPSSQQLNLPDQWQWWRQRQTKQLSFGLLQAQQYNEQPTLEK